MSRFDRYYRKSLLSKIFVNGWGNPDLLQRIIENHKIISKRETCKDLIKSFDVTTHKKDENNSCITIEGSFLSPFHNLVPGVMDENNRIAKFQLLVPKTWGSKYKPLCIHFPGTGDHHFSRRKTFLANRLLKDGIASLIHINPFYGNRKPLNQKGSKLNYLSDLLVMGGALILETHVLLKWAKSEGFYPLAVHGISMGGHMACLGVSVYPEPVCLIPCLSWTTASHVFTQGAMSSSVSWDVLSNQFNNDEVFSKKIRPSIEPPIPVHLKNLITPPKNIIEENKVKNTPDKINRKIHLPVLKKDESGSKRRNLSNDDSSTIRTKSKLQSLRNTFSWTRPIELASIMRSVTESDKITNEELENIHKQEVEIKYKMTFEKFFSKSIAADAETIEFMRDILDYFTHLGNYSVPLDTRLVTIIAAGNDAYIPIEGVSHFHDIWGTCVEIRIREGIGHVEAYLRSSLWTEDHFRIFLESMNELDNEYSDLFNFYQQLNALEETLSIHNQYERESKVKIKELEDICNERALVIKTQQMNINNMEVLIDKIQIQLMKNTSEEIEKRKLIEKILHVELENFNLKEAQISIENDWTKKFNFTVDQYESKIKKLIQQNIENDDNLIKSWEQKISEKNEEINRITNDMNSKTKEYSENIELIKVEFELRFEEMEKHFKNVNNFTPNISSDFFRKKYESLQQESERKITELLTEINFLKANTDKTKSINTSRILHSSNRRNEQYLDGSKVNAPFISAANLLVQDNIPHFYDSLSTSYSKNYSQNVNNMNEITCNNGKSHINKSIDSTFKNDQLKIPQKRRLFTINSVNNFDY